MWKQSQLSSLQKPRLNNSLLVVYLRQYGKQALFHFARQATGPDRSKSGDLSGQG